MDLTILPQPDDNSCGPTSLHAVYRYYDLEVDLTQLIADISSLETGGTLAVYLGIDALRRGMEATIYSYNLKMFDPTWANLDTHALIDKLEQQQEFKKKKRFLQASQAYIAFLRQGGRILFDQLTPELSKAPCSSPSPSSPASAPPISTTRCGRSRAANARITTISPGNRSAISWS